MWTQIEEIEITSELEHAFSLYFEEMAKKKNKSIHLSIKDKQIMIAFIYLSITEDTLVLFMISPCPVERLCGRYYKEKKYNFSPIFEGDLNLSYAKLIRIPDITVKGNLNLYGCSIETLPSGLKVFGALDIRNTSIQSLEGIVVGGDLYLNNKILDVTKIKVKGTIFCPVDTIKSLRYSFSNFVLAC